MRPRCKEPVEKDRLHRANAGDRVVLIDGRGRVITASGNWTRFPEAHGVHFGAIAPGVNYLDVCRRASASRIEAKKVLVGLSHVLKGEAESFAMRYECASTTGPAYFRIIAVPIAYGDARIAVLHTEATDQDGEQQNLEHLRQFARGLINAQEEERQRIAREIHDELGARAALISLSLDQLIRRTAFQREDVEAMKTIQEALKGLSASLRDLSHWLHPPSLRYLGLGPALLSLGDKLQKIHGIRMDVVIPDELPRLDRQVELSMFRIAQECVQNAVKHARVNAVRIELRRTLSEIRLTVSDDGCGFDVGRAVRNGGLGLASMRERALSMHSRLRIISSPDAGTEIVLSVPFPRSWSAFQSETRRLRIA